MIQFHHFPDLAYLDISNTQITDNGLMALAKQDGLSELDLESTNVTDIGLDKLKNMRNLHSLFIGSTRVSDAGLQLLTQSVSLKHVDITQCELVTEVGRSALKQAGIQVE